MTSRVLYLFGSAAPPVLSYPEVVRLAQADGWRVCVGLTPTAADWLAADLAALGELTGYPVRSRYKSPGDPDVWPPADAVAFAPITFNSINSWALGLTSSFVVGVAAEAIGKGIPICAMPSVNVAFTQHPQFEMSVSRLRKAGVTVLYGPDGFVPNQPGRGNPEEYPWNVLLGSVSALGSPR
ncbi:flavoprotein [Wenjunlia vitaminophila]|uniref:Flavoprotein n=1 Tax=Wenjunlia vitaminophila TaxID=76728 RepID=A0A0T6LP77_WENVI|nr:flavoprotein [Wenjunlia vitaminophila]KRV47914.1 flavoprotein [Wenjunlia vitaminophila]